MTDSRLLFGGGGDERDSRPLDEIFAGWVGKGRLLYLPTALVHPSNKEAGLRWMQQTYAPLGIQDIEAWMNLPGKSAREMAEFDAVYIGGGNTFYLLQQLRHYHLDTGLEEFIQQGKPVYGGSAGAIVLGYDIISCAHIDENIIGMTDYAGLDQALGYTIWCHYTPEDYNRIKDYVARSGIPSIALSERSGTYREGDHLIAAGYEPVVHFTLQGASEVPPGKQII